MKKENFFKKAFREMKESAKAQHKVDKANFEAVKAESKANFEENRWQNTLKRAKGSSVKRKELVKEKQEEEIRMANERIEAANERIEKAKEERN